MTELPKPLIVITGPTASGKSSLSLAIAKKYSGEIICADSRTVYRGMDIGTAKPTKAERQEVPHHLLDVAAPDESFTAADFKEQAVAAIDDISRRKKLPIIVGGTGLYIDSLIFNYQFGESADPIRRAQLQDLAVTQLQQMCLMEGITLPENTKNKRHLIRAIELGGITNQKKRLRPNTIVVALTTDRDNLRSRVMERAQGMVEQGVLKEVEKLGKKYTWTGEALTGSIYRIMHPVVDGELSVEEGINQVVTSDMQLAKRQMTWLKRNPYIVWGSPDQLMLAIEHFVHQNKLIESMPAPPLSATI